MTNPSDPEPAMLRDVADLAARFDAFFVDQFGVLHDGAAPYPGAVEALERLSETGKPVVLLSNSGKRAAPNESRLARLGFRRGSWTHFLSSGEVAWRRFAGLDGDAPLAPETHCLLLARDGDRSAVEGLGIVLTDDPASADLVLIAASEGDRFPLEHYRTLLAPAAGRGVPAFCTNPDKTMLTGATSHFGAGRIAELYEELGGPVEWIGKPFPAIYRVGLSLAGHFAGRSIACVGDSIEHDIAGGLRAGLSTVLVRSGILADAPANELATLYQSFSAKPDFVLPRFTWHRA